MANKQEIYGKSQIDNDEILTLKETALIMKASVSSMYDLFNDAGFPAKKLPRLGWRVRKSDLFSYIQNSPKYGNE
jgi:predicted DNA-binding transcriptional regulator AlpA